MTDYNRDHLGRPVSEDGHWVWNGAEWAARTPEDRAMDAQASPVATLVEEPQYETQPEIQQETSYAEPADQVVTPDTDPAVDEPAPVDYFPEPTQQAVAPAVPNAEEFAAAGHDEPATTSFQAPPVMDFRATLADREQDEDDTEDADDLAAQTFGGPKPVGHRAIRPEPRRTAAAADFSTSSKDDMSLGRLAATTVGVVLSLAGALMLSVAVATILIMRAFQKAMEQAMTSADTGGDAFAGPGDTQTTMLMVYAIGFLVATLAAFSVLYAARVPKAIFGAAGIVVLSFAAFYGLDKSGVEIQSWTGILLLPLVPAIATAGFVKWATR